MNIETKVKIKKLYKKYCDLHFKYHFDPVGLFVTLMLTNCIKTPLLSALLYFCTTLIIRIPLFLENDSFQDTCSNLSKNRNNMNILYEKKAPFFFKYGIFIANFSLLFGFTLTLFPYMFPVLIQNYIDYISMLALPIFLILRTIDFSYRIIFYNQTKK